MADEALAWITDIFKCQYKKAKDARNLCSEKVWHMYEVVEGFEEHREAVIWAKASNELKKAICSAMRPDYFKKPAISRLIKAVKP